MIIDLILDRKDGCSYQPDRFYSNVLTYASVDGIGADICEAMDYGAEDDVRKALCAYITCNDYNPAICDYINSVSWLEEADALDLVYEEAALRDWELSAIEVGDYLVDNDTIVRVVSIDHSTGEYSFSVKYPAGYVTCFDARSASRCKVINDTSSWEDQRRAAELWAGHAITSHATYYVVEFDGDYLTATVNFSQAGYESREQWQRRRAQAFFRTVAERYAFNDCSDDRVLEVVFDGCHIEYAGWQPGMLIEFREVTTGLIVFSERFPEWDH